MIIHLAGLVAFALWASACQKHIKTLNAEERERAQLFKRQADFPPVLTKHEAVLLNSFDNNSISDWSYYYTHGAHVAGMNRTDAKWTADKFASNGFKAHLTRYFVYLNYPVSHSMKLSYSNGTTFVPSLKEAVLREDPTTSYPNRIPTFNGYSFSGNAKAEFVYVGEGTLEDFDRLTKLGVPLKGKIAISKYGGPFRGIKVKNSQTYGMIGTVLFTDLTQDGEVTEANGYAPYPHGPARQPTSVQRGTVQFISDYSGDPTTPGYPSKEGSPRVSTKHVLPQIPSIPISYVDAKPILAALDGHGTPGHKVHREGWVGLLNVSYSTGPAPGVVLSMDNQMRDTITPIWDAIGIINGTSEDEVVIIGNHRDAWIIGGAADPNSGTAILVELSKAFGKLLKTGWKPRRTIVLASWDGEEYGLLGSTEWMEEYLPWLNGSAVSYLNIDVGCSGPRPGMDASPELHHIIKESMKKVIWPLGNANETLFDVWYDQTGGEIGVLGSGSDYTSFVHRGIGAIDMASGPGPTDPVYHYHSNYDSYHWMTKYGDPEFKVHVAMGQWLAILAYYLADDEVIPFHLPAWTIALQTYYKALQKVIKSSGHSLDTSELAAAIKHFTESAHKFMTLKHKAVASGDAHLITAVNHRLRDFQRGFTSQGGLPNREFYRHVVYAPGIDTGYAAVTYPGITEAVEAGDFALAAEWVKKTSQGIIVAANTLKM